MAHERDRDEVDLLVDREVDPVEVGLADRRQRDVGVGELRPCLRAHRAADLDLGRDVVSVDSLTRNLIRPSAR